MSQALYTTPHRLQHTCAALVVCVLLGILTTACSIQTYQGADDVLYTGIKQIDFDQNIRDPHIQSAISAAEAQLSYAPNNAIFGSSSYRWPLPLLGPWVYLRNAADSTFVSKWLTRTFGSRPTWLRDVNPVLRSRATERILSEFGYLNASVTPQLHFHKQDSLQAKISYQIHLGRLFRFDSIEYLPPFPLQDSLPLVHREVSSLHKGSAFALADLHRDRTTISNTLREHGYYYFKPEHIHYEADTMATPYEVALRSKLIDGINPESLKPWRVRRIHLRFPSGNIQTQTLLNDTLHLGKGIIAYYDRAIPLRRKILDTRIRLRPDSLYRQSLADLTLSNLSNLGIFSEIELIFNPVEVDTPANYPERELDLSIIMYKDRLWELSLESSFKLKSTDFVGPGLRIGFDRKNIFGGGEVLSTGLYGSYEWQTGRNPFNSFSTSINSYQIGAETSLVFPTLLFPSGLDRFYKYPTSTTFKLSGQRVNRAQFYGMSSFGFGWHYDFMPREGRTHSITPLSVNYNMLSYITGEFSNILSKNPSLILSMQDQLVPQMGYTYTWDEAVGKSKQHRFWVKSGISQAGNLINLAFMAAGRQYSATKNILGLPYAQFVKGTSELRYTYTIDRNQKLATRLSLGAIYPYGNLYQAPYNEQFYIGGANSLRAFTVRSLGPGRYKPTEESIYTFLDRVGEAKLELNTEYRGRLVGNLEAALFVDAGNVWLLRPDPDKPNGALSEVKGFVDLLDQIAVGTGFGLRYDLSYLVVRFDVGVGLHLPYQTKRKGWYNIPHFGDALGIHLAIGYPF